MKKIKIKTYLEAVDEIGIAIDNSNGNIKDVAKHCSFSIASIYRYIEIEPKLKYKLYIARIKQLKEMILINKQFIKIRESEFYATEKVKEFLKLKKNDL
jgi:hypothetical protein